MYPPTMKQRQAEIFIEKYLASNDGVSPTITEIAAALGVSYGTARNLVKGLISRGRATMAHKRERTIQLIKDEGRAA